MRKTWNSRGLRLFLTKVEFFSGYPFYQMSNTSKSRLGILVHSIDHQVGIAVAAAVGLVSATALYLYRRRKNKTEKAKKEEEKAGMCLIGSYS